MPEQRPAARPCVSFEPFLTFRVHSSAPSLSTVKLNPFLSCFLLTFLFAVFLLRCLAYTPPLSGERESSLLSHLALLVSLFSFTLFLVVRHLLHPVLRCLCRSLFRFVVLTDLAACARIQRVASIASTVLRVAYYFE